MRALVHAADWHATRLCASLHPAPSPAPAADAGACARAQLCDLYENDCIFDKFDCCVNGQGDQVIASYHGPQNPKRPSCSSMPKEMRGAAGIG